MRPPSRESHVANASVIDLMTSGAGAGVVSMSSLMALLIVTGRPPSRLPPRQGRRPPEGRESYDVLISGQPSTGTGSVSCGPLLATLPTARDTGWYLSQSAGGGVSSARAGTGSARPGSSQAV